MPASESPRARRKRIIGLPKPQVGTQFYTSVPRRKRSSWAARRSKGANMVRLSPLSSLVRATLRLVACSIGAAAALGALLWFIDPPSSPLLVASFGGTVVFLFGLTRAPAVQPRALFGGHLSGALIGIVCFQALGDAT